MLLHYHQKTFHATATGSIIKEVVCEQCQLRYYYQMVRFAMGSGIAPYGMGEVAAEANAQHQAQMRLSETLVSDCEAVPCPQCGRVQQHAIEHFRRNQYLNLRVLVWALPQVGAFLTLLFLMMARVNDSQHLTQHWFDYCLAAVCWMGLWFLLRALRNWLIARGSWLQTAIQHAPPALLPQSAVSPAGSAVEAISPAQTVNSAGRE